VTARRRSAQVPMTDTGQAMRDVHPVLQGVQIAALEKPRAELCRTEPSVPAARSTKSAPSLPHLNCAWL